MITLTESAATHIKSRLERNNTVLGVKIAVKRTGCSGYAYDLSYVEHTPCIPCVVIKEKDVTIFVDPKDEIFVSDLKIDFKKEKLQQHFVFENPQETGRCGCGASVTFK